MAKPPELAGPWSLLILVLLGVIVFVPPVWDAQFLNFDDNLFFGDGEPTAFDQVWETGDVGAILDPRRTIANAYLPVSHLSLFLDASVSRVLGGGAAWARLHSLLLHVLAAWLLARLLGRLGLMPAAATAAAAVFLVHPALVESVGWLSSRKDVLSGLFSFACLSAVAQHAREPRRSTLWWAALWAVLALYSKGTAVVLLLLAPVVTLLVTVDPDGAGRRRRRWGPVVAVGAVVLAAGLHHTAIAASQGTMAAGAGAERLARVPGALAHYLLTLAWPTGLNVLYPEALTLQQFAAAVVPAATVLVAVAAAVLWVRRRRPLLAAGLVMVFLALAPFNTAWPASSIAAADRYLYLVVPWFALALVGAAPTQRAGAWCAALLVVPLAWLASERVRDFGSSEALWESSLAVEPQNAVARINLAQAVQGSDPVRARDLVEQAVRDARHPVHRSRAESFLSNYAWREGRLEEAQRHATGACEALAELPLSEQGSPLQLESLLRLATLQLLRDQDGAAEKTVATLRELAPDHPAVLAFRATVMLTEIADDAGRVAADELAWELARPLLERALERDPESFEANLARAKWDQARGEWMAAVRHLRRARRAAPERPETYLDESQLMLATGEFEGAENAARDGMAAGARDPNLLIRLGQALALQGRLGAAQEFYQRYLAERPGDLAARRALAAVLVASVSRKLYQSSAEELERAAERIRDLHPDNPQSWLLLGQAERQRRNLEAALVCLERAHELLPESDDALRLLAETRRDRGYQLLRDPDATEAALDQFRAFVDLAAPGVDTSSSVGILRSHWERIEHAGTEAFGAGDYAAAEVAFRRCLALVPEQSSAGLQLGLTLLKSGREHWGEALSWFEKAELGQREVGLDASIPVLYQVLTLQRLGRLDEAGERGRQFLADPTPSQPDVMERIRIAIDS